MAEVKNKKSSLRVALERTARTLCEPPLTAEKMAAQSTAGLMQYVAAHRAEENQPVQENLYKEAPDPVGQERLTNTIRDNIDKAGTVNELENIYAKFPVLHKNKEFIYKLGVRKKQIYAKLNNTAAANY